MREAARLLQIEPLLGRKPKELSGGERQRVAIGRAIVRHPKVFLFDEPLSNLDAALRGQMRLEIMRLHDELQATMLYVTHDQIEAMTMADVIVVLNGGLIEQVGTPLDLYHRPRNLFVAGFIGSPQMNFLQATVDRSGESGTTVALAGGARLEVPAASGRLVRARAFYWASGPSTWRSAIGEFCGVRLWSSSVWGAPLSSMSPSKAAPWSPSRPATRFPSGRMTGFRSR